MLQVQTCSTLAVKPDSAFIRTSLRSTILSISLRVPVRRIARTGGPDTFVGPVIHALYISSLLPFSFSGGCCFTLVCLIHVSLTLTLAQGKTGAVGG